MNIIWYPGCGQDFNPVLTLLRSNPRRDHVPQRGPKDDGPILWMTDYCPDVIRCFDGLKPGDPLPVSPFQARDGLVGGLRVHFDDRDGREPTGDEVEIRDVRRFPLPCAEMAKRTSAKKWVARSRSDLKDVGNREDKVEDRHRHALLKLRRERERANPRRRQSPPLGIHVTELTLRTRRRFFRPAKEIRVWFSPFESEAALKYVFGPLKVRLHCLVLVRLGGFSCQRPELDHHDRRFFELLSDHAEATGTGLPGFVLTDKDTVRWDDPDPYEPTCVSYEGWARLFRKRGDSAFEEDHRGLRPYWRLVSFIARALRRCSMTISRSSSGC